MDVRFGIHWWRFTTPVRDVEEVLDSIVGVSGGDFGTPESRGAYNQPNRYLHTSGVGVYFGSSRDTQPIVIDASGEACERVTQEDLSMWADNLSGRVTRCDVAADVDPPDESRARLLEMREAFRRRKCDTKIPHTSTRFYESDQPGDGCTLYVGSTQSDCMLRAYDRRGPLRLEWQWKPMAVEVREDVPEKLAKYGAAGIWRKLGRRCIWPMKWYQDVLTGQCADIATAPARPDDLSRTLTAIAEQLGPTLAALQLLGVTMGDLAKMPTKPNREQLIRWEAWCQQAGDLGYDASRLRVKVRRCRKSN